SRAEDPAVDMPEADFRRDAGVPEGLELAGSGPLTAQLWTRPALSVSGIDAPAAREASNTIGPAGRPTRSRGFPPAPAPAPARQALEAAWGAQPVDTELGGATPFVADLLEVFPEAEVPVTGVEDPESRAHGIDESLHLGEFAHVCLGEALLLRGAGELGTDQAVSSEGTA